MKSKIAKRQCGRSHKRIVRYRMVARIAVYSLVGWFALWWSPFDVGGAAKRASQNAIYNVLAPLYPRLEVDNPPKDSRRLEILVIAVDEQALGALRDSNAIQSKDWPLKYSDQALIIGQILEFAPKALVVNFYFKHAREGKNSVEIFLDDLDYYTCMNHDDGDCKTESPAEERTPVFFARGSAGENLTTFQKQLRKFSALVPVAWTSSGYPLAIPGNSENGRLTPAAAVLQRLCDGNNRLYGCEAVKKGTSEKDGTDMRAPPAVSVFWGSNPPAMLPEGFARPSCAKPAQDLVSRATEIGVRVVKGLFSSGGSATQTCPFHRVLRADDLILSSRHGGDYKTAVRELVEDRVVFYGAGNIDGVADHVISPVHGRLPGVFEHAMALDNLQVFGKDYLRVVSSGESYLQNATSWSAFVVAMAFVAYRKELNEPNFLRGKPCRRCGGRTPMPFRRAFTLGLAGYLLLLSMAIILLYISRVEPVNAFGMMGLATIITVLVTHGFEERARFLFLGAKSCLRRIVVLISSLQGRVFTAIHILRHPPGTREK